MTEPQASNRGSMLATSAPPSITALLAALQPHEYDMRSRHTHMYFERTLYRIIFMLPFAEQSPGAVRARPRMILIPDLCCARLQLCYTADGVLMYLVPIRLVFASHFTLALHFTVANARSSHGSEITRRLLVSRGVEPINAR